MWAELTHADAILAAVFGIWFLAICVHQLPITAARQLTTWDPIGLLPVWRFFAPMPGNFDFHLLYRDQLADGTITPWTEYRPLLSRSPWSFIWNPDKRQRKALLDLAQELVRFQREQSREQLLLSVPYLVLLNFVSELPRPEPRQGTQFAIMVSRGAAHDEEPQLLFLSSLHPLEC